MELCQVVLLDENSGESADKLAFGAIGDLADCFQDGRIKGLLLGQEWIAKVLNTKTRYAKDTKATIRWARSMVNRATA